MSRDPLTAESLRLIHETSMRVLSQVGVFMPQEVALGVFRSHGLRVEGGRVFLEEDEVMEALEDVPKSFSLDAREPSRKVTIGGGRSVFAPGYGAPFIVDSGGRKRSGTMEDYRQLVKISHELPNMDLSGHLIVEPEVPQAHLHILHAHLTHSDKPFIGSTAGSKAATQTLEMAAIAFGDDLIDRSVCISLVNSLSPLGYAADMLDALMVYVRARQPVVIAALAMAGSTAPVTLAGLLAMQTAELMAGIVLAQLVSPGTPVVLGTTSSNIDMRTGSLSIGSPELSMIIAAHAQLARFYGVPSRAGGSLTDASYPDAQSGLESMLSLLTTVDSGVDIVLHAAGILAGYLAFSYEKLVLDDEMCGMIRHLQAGFDVSHETLCYGSIAAVGSECGYLQESLTLRRCHTEFYRPTVCDRAGLSRWVENRGKDAVDRAKARWQELLEAHEDPPMDADARRLLDSYVEAHG